MFIASLLLKIMFGLLYIIRIEGTDNPPVFTTFKKRVPLGSFPSGPRLGMKEGG
jgi:hypothetical protein